MTLRERRIHRARDPREAPLYTVAEAAHHLHLPPATLRSWVAGRRYRLTSGEDRFSPPLIHRPDPEDERISFTNLVEAHVLHALRARHRVSMPAVRRALEYAEEEFGIRRLLIRQELLAAPGEMFLKEYGRLLSLTRSGQFAMEKILESFLRRVVRDAEGLPLRLYPFTSPDPTESRKVVAIDPSVSYGRPIVARKGVSTAFLAERLNAGESVEELAEDYELKEEEVAEAIVFERAA